MPATITVCELCGTRMPTHYVCTCGHRFRYVSEGAVNGGATKMIKLEGDDGKLYAVPLPVARKVIHAVRLAEQIVRYLDDNVRPSTLSTNEETDHAFSAK